MRLLLVCVGRTKAGPERELVGRYIARAAAAGRSLGFGSVEHRELDESRARRPEDRKSEEAKKIRALLGDSGRFIACEESGANLSSADFALRLGKLRDQGIQTLGLVIGGPDGLEPEFCAKAEFQLAFGAMTWPHQLAQAMAAEQIYRALTILSGHPYHRA